MNRAASAASETVDPPAPRSAFPDRLPCAEIPVDGIVCHGHAVELGWPREDEFDRLTALRNRPHVRCQFFDSRCIDVTANREWLRNGMRRPAEALLAIRTRGAGELRGMIGWTGWSARTRAPELGRIVVDTDARRSKGLRADAGVGIALDAVIAVRDYLFATAGARLLRTRYFAGNRHAARINRLAGGRIVRRATVSCADGRHADMLELELTRDEWLERGRVAP